MDEAIISVEGLRAGYGGRTILQDVSFTVRRGEVFVILGGSGCGKSTLLKHMIGLNDPISGRVYIDGDDWMLWRKRPGRSKHPSTKSQRRQGIFLRNWPTRDVSLAN